MSTILAYTSPAVGHLFPMTPLLLELQRRGHFVHVRTLADQVEGMRRLGLHAEPIAPEIEELRVRDWDAKTTMEGLALNAQLFAARGVIEASDLMQAIDDVRPDAAIVDVGCLGATLAGDRWGGPWASFCPYTPPIPSKGTPPFGPGLPPARGLVGMMRDAIVRRVITSMATRTHKAPLNELRAELGLEPVDIITEPLWVRPMLRRPPLLLVATAKPFEYETSNWGPDVVTMGACAWEPPTSPPSWLAEIDQPIVLVTTSSEFQDDGILVRTALQALADEPVHVVATTPAGPLANLPLPANATIAEFVPHNHLLERAVVAITHGGMGATQKALAHAVPVCVVPFGRDQLEVARRVEHSKAGTRLPARRLTPDRLRDAVTSARTMTDGARRVADGFRSSGGPSAGATAIEERLLDTSQHHDRRRAWSPDSETGKPAS